MRRPRSVVLPTIVLGLTGVLLIVAAIINLLARDWRFVAIGIAEAGVGALMIVAVLGLDAGHRRWWLVSIGLVPVTGLVHFVDAYAFGGDGRVSVLGGVVAPVLALACLLLPSTRAHLARNAAESVQDAATA